jgi:hypothetical protein
MKRVDSERPLRELPATANDPLAVAVRAALAEDPTSARLDRLGLALDAALVAGSAPKLLEQQDASPSVARAPDRSGVFKVASLVVMGTLIAAVVLVGGESRRPQSVAPAAAHEAAKRALPPAAVPIVEQPPQRAPAPMAPTERDHRGSRGRAYSPDREPDDDEIALPSERAQRLEPERAVDPADELGLLRRAQQALPHDGAQALLYVQTHEHAFPHGLLEQEREVLAIGALLAIGDITGAEQRASAFRQAFPHSAHLRRVDRLLTNERMSDPANGNRDATETRTP